MVIYIIGESDVRPRRIQAGWIGGPGGVGGWVNLIETTPKPPDAERAGGIPCPSLVEDSDDDNTFISDGDDTHVSECGSDDELPPQIGAQPQHIVTRGQLGHVKRIGREQRVLAWKNSIPKMCQHYSLLGVVPVASVLVSSNLVKL